MFIKCLKHPQNKQKLSGAVDGHRWYFLKSGLDDYRDGYPPNIGQEIFVSKQCNISPVLFGKACSTAKMNRKLLPKEQVCFSKEIPLKQTRHAHVEAVEEMLTQHPLALYPYLERGMAPEVS